MRITRLVILFNKGKILLGIAISLICFLIAVRFSGWISISLSIIGGLVVLNILMAIGASYLLYDRSILYKPKELCKGISFDEGDRVILLHASFDPVSTAFEELITPENLEIYNIYGNRHEQDKAIRISNQVFPPREKEKKVDPTKLPDKSNSVEYIFAITSLHEILSHEKRIEFFREAKRVLKPNGKLIIVEQLRNWMNFIFFNIGAFHFVSLSNWEQGIIESGLRIDKTEKITPWGSLLHVTK